MRLNDILMRSCLVMMAVTLTGRVSLRNDVPMIVLPAASAEPIPLSLFCDLEVATWVVTGMDAFYLD